jgi:hypothetical protein
MPGERDDPVGIPDSTRLYRRINPDWIVYDSNSGERRPTSQNFQDSKDGSPMSVFAENVMIARGESPVDLLRGIWNEWFLVAIPAGWMRECGQEVYLDTANQDPDDWRPSHASVRGRKDGKVRARLGKYYEWVTSPPNRYQKPE